MLKSLGHGGLLAGPGAGSGQPLWVWRYVAIRGAVVRLEARTGAFEATKVAFAVDGLRTDDAEAQSLWKDWKSAG